MPIEAIWMGVVLVFVAAGSLAAAFRLKRAADIATYARRVGLEHSDTDPFSSLRIAFELFRRGDEQTITSVIWPAEHPRHIRAFDFEWCDVTKDEHGREQRTCRHASCAMALVGGSWPNIAVLREGLGTRMASVLAPSLDIDLESEEFNRSFVVRCDDARFAHALLDARMVDWLVSTGGHFGFELRGRWLLVFGDPVKAQLLPGMLRLAETFCERVPEVVWELYPSEFVDADRQPLPIENEAGLAFDRLSLPGGGLGGLGRDDPFDILGESPYPALRREDAEEGPPAVEYDLDGDPITPVREDPWGTSPPPPPPSS